MNITKMRPRKARVVLVAAAASMLTCVVAGATETGAIVGVVTGPTGHPLPGAVVVAHRSDGDPARSTVTGAGGAFRLTDLEPGEYGVEGSLRGFHPTPVDHVRVEPGQQARVTIGLSSATFNDTMEVSSVVPPGSLEASEIRESAASDLGEALSRLPGVWKSRRGGIANDVVVRGFREDDLTVLVDGARVAGACPNRMDPPVFHLDFAEVDRVEVPTGGGRLAAQGSMGGLVSVVTKKPAPGWHADVPVVVGSNELFNPSATVGYGGERFGVLGGVSTRSSSAYEDGSGNKFTELANYRPDAVDLDAYDVTSEWARVFFQPTEAHELSLSYTRQDSDIALYPALMMDAEYDDTDRAVLGYRHEPASGALDHLRATVYGTRVEHWMTDSHRTSSTTAPRGWGMGTMASTSMVGGSAEAVLGAFTLGAEAYLRNWDAWTELAMMSYRRQYSIPDVDVTAVGLSARWQHSLSSSTHLDAGIRVDRVETAADDSKAPTDLYFAYHGVRGTSRTDTEPSASIQLVHRFAGPLTLSGGLASTTRSPDPRERYFGLRRMGGDWVGDPELAPPRSNRAEVELGWDLGAGVVTATAWVDVVDDFITVAEQARLNDVPGVANTRARSYANVDAVLRGISLVGTTALGSHLSLAGQVSYLRGTKDADPTRGITSENLAEMPPLTARLALRWQNPRYFGEVEGVGVARQDDVDSDLGETTTPGYGLVNLRGGLSRGPWRAQLVLENLLDRTYHEHFSYLRDPFRSGTVVPEPGRRVILTLGWSL